MQSRTVTIGETEVEVVPAEGSLIDGVLTVSSVDVRIKDDTYLRLSEDIDWEAEDTEEKLEEELRTAWMEGERWPDTADPDWKEPRGINVGTDAWKTLKAIIDNYPVTNEELVDLVDYEYSPSSQTADLKEARLVATVGVEDGHQQHVPTHLGLKNMYEYNGIDGSRGLGALDLTPADNESETSES